MNISIIPGATCAVVRMKIKAKVGSTYTRWKLLYKKSSASSYSETEEMQYDSSCVYGNGPLFYDLTGLSTNTTYNIKLVITTQGGGLPSETSVSTFQTCASGVFDFKSRTFLNAEDDLTEDDFNALCDWFKNQMIAVGYSYRVTNTRSKSPFANTDYFAADISVDADTLRAKGSGGESNYKEPIVLRYVDVNGIYDRQALVHEYRHFLGLSSNAGVGTGGFIYHGDVSSPGFWRDETNESIQAQSLQYCKNISRVYGFARGCDTDEMEIYMFHGENAIDTTFLNSRKPVYDGWRLLGFMLLKALGLNDITIVY